MPDLTDPELEQIQRYGQALGGVTPFDEAVHDHAIAQERNYAKMKAAATGGSGLGPPEIQQQQAKQEATQEQQIGDQGSQKAQQAQASQTPIPAPPAPSGPLGVTQPYPVQAGQPMGGTEQPPAGANPQPEPPPPAPQPGS